MDRRRMTILIIAEKPSVAPGLAKHFGNARRQDGYLSTGPYLITWCFGHLMELAEPQVYDEHYQKWRAASALPAFPPGLMSAYFLLFRWVFFMVDRLPRVRHVLCPVQRSYCFV